MVTFDGQAPAGTLDYVTGYTGFNSDPSEQSGYFLPFTINAAEEAEVKMWVSDEGKQVVCDKSPAVNVVFLGATKEIAQEAISSAEIFMQEWDKVKSASNKTFPSSAFIANKGM